jgi:(p)ppGpp synthase/HD superfamily hydrolase
MSLDAYLELPASEQEVRACLIAQVAHAGVLNKKNGEPYVEHPTRVVAHSQDLSEEAGCSSIEASWVAAACWLHDTVEDTPITLDWLTSMGFPSIVVHIVSLLTRTKDVPDFDYYAAIADHALARLAKLADLADNTDPERLAQLDGPTRARLCLKYVKAYRALDAEVPDHLAGWTSSAAFDS